MGFRAAIGIGAPEQRRDHEIALSRATGSARREPRSRSKVALGTVEGGHVVSLLYGGEEGAPRGVIAGSARLHPPCLV